MANKWQICIDVNEVGKNVLLHALGRGTIDTGLEGVASDLRSQIKLAWMEAEFRDEAEAHNDWVNREMYGIEVEPNPDVVVRHVGGRDLVVRR